MPKKKKAKPPKVPDPTSYADFRTIYQHYVEEFGNKQFSPFGPTLEWEGFAALELLAKKMGEFVVSAHAKIYAPFPVYEASSGLMGFFGGAGITWYIKPPMEPGATTMDAHGRTVPDFQFASLPIDRDSHRGSPVIQTGNLTEALVWAEMLNAGLERRKDSVLQ
jgi:hypothetical protein